MYQREASFVSALSERDEKEGELRKRIDEAKRRKEDLENELANMWVLVAKLRNSGTYSEESSSEGVHASIFLQTRGGNESSSNGFLKKILNVYEMCEKMDDSTTFEELEARYIKERRRCKELESFISKLKVVAGGGAVEAALSVYLEHLATTLRSREQLTIAEFVESLLIIPKVLAVNAVKDATELEDCFNDLPYNTGYQIFVLRLWKTRDKIMKCTLSIYVDIYFD